MAFGDFLKKLFGVDKPKAPPVPPAPMIAETLVPITVTAPVVPPMSPPTIVAAAAKPDRAANAGDFLPIRRDDLLQQGEEVRRTSGWMFFGRRDIIPPISDPRTLLIDRGMVSQGLIQPADLATMHAVGDEYAKHAHRLDAIKVEAGKNAEQAVEADRAARALIKVQKKAAAAERRRLHAEGVAHRKATDIRFIGRGVSALLNQRESDATLLADAGLPVLHTPADLATALSLTIGQLRWLAFHTDVATRIHYVQFEIPKKSGGVRTLSAPHVKLATAQEWILAEILGKLPTEAPAHGLVPGRSIVTNALPHVGKDVVINVDLEDFFPGIRFGRVRALFRRLGYSGSVATLLALIVTECPRKKVTYDGTVYFVATGPRGLPQGACTSPAISNQIARKLDRRLVALMTKLGFTYTRYADDLTFSAPVGARDKVGYVLARVRHICEDEGFRLNAKKTRVQRPSGRQSVTGLVVNAKPAVPREVLKRIRAILHRAKTEGLDAQNREGLPHFRLWLDGMIAYVAMVQPKHGEAFREQLGKL